MLIPLVGVVSYPYSLVFVWRQLESAFFGATTSVVALFVFSGVFAYDNLNFNEYILY